MAKTTQYSNEYKKAYVHPTGKLPPTELTGRVRLLRFSFTQDGPGDVGSSFIINRLPSGTVLVLSHSALFSSMADPNIALGWDEYRDREEIAQATDAQGLASNLTVSGGVISGGAITTKLFDSIAGVDLRLTVNTPLTGGETFHGYLFYVVD